MSSRNEASNNETRESDSSDEETPINPEVRILSRIFGVHRASVASIPGTSGVGHSVAVSPAPAPAPRRSPRQERDRLFWTMVGNRRSPNRTRGTGARVPRPTTAADVLEPERERGARATPTAPARRGERRAGVTPNLRPPCPISGTTVSSNCGYTPSSPFDSFQKSLCDLLRRRNRELEARNRASANARAGGDGSGSGSGGRQVFVVHARGEPGERSERSERAARRHGERANREEHADDEDRSAASAASTTADDSGTADDNGCTPLSPFDSFQKSLFEVLRRRNQELEARNRAYANAEEPVNMSSGALVLEEEILEVEDEPAAPATMDAEATDGSTETSQPARAAKRKRELSGETHESVSALNQSILQLLECPVCMEWMEPPITQCRRGHLVCGACRKRLDTCPVCRTPFSSVRNRAMEDVAGILRYPCRHGCGSEVRAARRQKHEASCASRRLACPLPACRAAPSMPRTKLAQHCQSKHPGAFKTGAVHVVSLPVDSEQHVQWVVSALGALFHVRVDMDVRAWGVLAIVAHLGPVDRAPSYTYEVAVNGRHNARRLVYTRATHSDLENSALNTSRQDCFHLTLDQAMNYLRFKNEHSETDKTMELTITLAEAETEAEADDDAVTVADEG